MDWDLILFFSVPFTIGMSIGFMIKGFLNRYEQRREFDRYMDGLFMDRNSGGEYERD